MPDEPEIETPANEPTPAEPTQPTVRPLDPEDWASSAPDEDERYARERPPHWE